MMLLHLNWFLANPKWLVVILESALVVKNVKNEIKVVRSMGLEKHAPNQESLACLCSTPKLTSFPHSNRKERSRQIAIEKKMTRD